MADLHRIDKFKAKVVAIGAAILLFGIFLGMNSSPTKVWIFGWTPSLPLIVIALFCFAAGVLCGWGLSVFLRRKQEEEDLLD